MKASPPEDITAEEMVSRLLYRDGLMLVVDKPAGIAVHRGPKGGASLEDYFGALRFGLPRAPALAHRLDRDTSGCLVLGRHRKALAQLGKLFKSGAIGKTYWAVVEGGPDTDSGQIELPLGRLDVARGWWMEHDPTGQPAVTKWKVMGRSVAVRNFIASPLEGEAAELSSAGGGSIGDSHASRYPPSPTLPLKGGGSALGKLQRNASTHLARARTVDRTHASAARPLCRDELAHSRRCNLRDRIAQGRIDAAPACARGRRSALQKSRADPRRRSDPRAHARVAQPMRLAR
jgi:RNA pseudouridylate synthase